jgi:hypothetical protein
MKPTPSFLDELKVAADRCSLAEDAFRREIAARTKELENERAFAFRRLNLMRAIAEVIAGAEGEEIAVAAANAVLRAKLGWTDNSEARDVVISRFVPVAQAMFSSLSPQTEPASRGKKAPARDVLEQLTGFEKWYAETHPKPFWILFETYMPETPVVDF